MSGKVIPNPQASDNPDNGKFGSDFGFPMVSKLLVGSGLEWQWGDPGSPLMMLVRTLRLCRQGSGHWDRMQKYV